MQSGSVVDATKRCCAAMRARRRSAGAGRTPGGASAPRGQRVRMGRPASSQIGPELVGGVERRGQGSSLRGGQRVWGGRSERRRGTRRPSRSRAARRRRSMRAEDVSLATHSSTICRPAGRKGEPSSTWEATSRPSPEVGQLRGETVLFECPLNEDPQAPRLVPAALRSLRPPDTRLSRADRLP